MLNLKYKVWMFGPVSEDLYIDLSSETTILEGYITKNPNESYITSKTSFVDDEFSENDIELMNKVIQVYGNQTARELVSYTHRINSPWYNTAKENSVLQLLLNQEINSIELLIDMSQIIAHDARKLEIYKEYLESN